MCSSAVLIPKTALQQISLANIWLNASYNFSQMTKFLGRLDRKVKGLSKANEVRQDHDVASIADGISAFLDPGDQVHS